MLSPSSSFETTGWSWSPCFLYFVHCHFGKYLLYYIVTIYANVEKSEIIDNTDKQYVNDFLVAMYVISIFFLFLSVSGMYGTIKIKRKGASKVGNCLLSAYSIGVIVFAATFLVCTIVFFAAPPSILGESC